MINQHKKVLAVFIVLLLCVTGATAAGTGVLSASDVTDVALGDSGTVTYTLTNDFAPKVGALTYRVYYDETIATAVSTENLCGGVAPNTLNSGMTFTVSTATGLDGVANLFNITFTSLKNDGSSMDLGIVATTAVDTTFPPVNLLGDITITNGTFTTKDEVAPVINSITTPANVGKNFQITGSITEVGGMGSATATLAKGAETTDYPLTLTDQGNGVYTYTADASWPVFEDGITLSVNAVDAAGNHAAEKQTVINVKNVGFSDPSPEGYINVVPTEASAFMSQIDPATVTMTLSNGVTTTDLVVTIDGDYARGVIPLLGDGTYQVNVTGTGTILPIGVYSLPWTYTLDTSTPALDVTVTDSDGDGYIEANEDLTFTWAVSSPGASGFNNVAIVDTATSDVLWTDSSQNGMDVMDFLTGNRDLSFRAYDNAGNYAAYDFHLYNNYVAWVNSTKFGTISGLDTEFTAMVDMDRTATSMIELYDGRSIAAPDIGTVTRQVENVGQVTSDTYVTVDNRANATYAGTDTYQTLWAYDPTDIIDFEITAPAITRANVLMMEANESYISELIDAGSAGNINYEQLVKHSAYIFIDGGWTKITINNDGSYTQDVQVGNPLTASGTVTDMMKIPANQVDISSGFRMSTDCVAFDAATTPDVGDYALAALAFDGDRIGVIAMMPVVILETADEGALSASTVVVDGTFDASVSSDCEYFGVSLYRDTEYNATTTVDFANLNADMITVDLSAGGAATEKLWHNIYITSGAGKYAAVKNAKSLTFDVTGLEAGDYKAVLTGLSNNGTAQALGIHDITIVDRSLVANFTGTPTSGGSPLTVQFTDISAGTPTTWNWNFGDGNSSILQNPEHIYTTGVYDVTLNVTNALGEESTFTRMNYINVSSTSLNISDVSATPYISVADIEWTTNIAANSTVEYGRTAAYGNEVSDGSYVLAHGLRISGLASSTQYHYRIVSYDESGNMVATNDAVFVTKAAGGGGGGSGGGFVPATTPVQEFTTTGFVQTNSEGTVQNAVRIYAADKRSSVYLGEGIQALEANGQPVVDITIEETQDVPSPGASTFVFAGHAVKVGPAGATFSPAIELTFQLTEEEWNALKDGESFVIKWFNDATGEWDDIPTTVNPVTHTAIGEITHFSTFAVFKQSVESIVPAETQQTPSPTDVAGEAPVPDETGGETGDDGTPVGGFPWVWVIVLVALIAVTAGGYYYTQQKKD